MPGLLEDNGISYLSAQSAEVILSEVRNTRLKPDTLKSLNALLDEFLFNILKNASSFSTDKLRTSLLGLLPTSLGKEALLEAEVELRAYYEQMGTGAVSPMDDGSREFNVQYAFELLRLKCAAYSTLNDEDEDPKAEARVMEKMRDTGALPFSSVRIAPASMYVTAIVEAMCEHILSNLARVVARDSSRTDATVDDLFIALCEDEAIYSTFKSMKVYEQIEQLSNASQHNRSTLRSAKHSVSRRLSSAPHDPTATMVSSSNSSRTRMSAETCTTQSHTVSVSGSHPSFEKSKAARKLNSHRPSHERSESQTMLGHRRASQSESLRRASSTYEDCEDAAALQEFDDLMRSSSTMKVSLTPDRLRTMEAYKQERAQRTLLTKTEPDTAVNTISRKPSVRQVESIVEDEEEATPSKQQLPYRHRQGSVASSPSPPFVSLASRTRSLSLSTSGSRALGKKVMRNATPPVSSSHMFQNPSLPSPPQMPSTPDSNTYPTRKRRIQRNLDAMDLDDIMNGSGDEEAESTPGMQANERVVPRATGRSGRVGLSTTRDLIDFLAEGPPELLKYNADVLDSPSGRSSADAGKKSPSRLQRMISKLNLGNAEKVRAEERGPARLSPPLPSLGSKPSTGTLSSLANRPIPPRYPRPPSPPPSSPSSSEERTTSHTKSRTGPEQDTRSPHAVVSKPHDKIVSNHPGHDDQNANSNGTHKFSVPSEKVYPITPAPSQAPVTRAASFRKPVPPLNPPASPPVEASAPSAQPPPASARLFEVEVREMHQLMSQATSADECRLILDMFLARSGIQIDRGKPSPAALPLGTPTTIDSPLENTVVEFLLGGEAPLEALGSPKKLRSKRHRKGLALRPHTADGSLSPQRSPVVSNPSPVPSTS